MGFVTPRKLITHDIQNTRINHINVHENSDQHETFCWEMGDGIDVCAGVAVVAAGADGVDNAAAARPDQRPSMTSYSWSPKEAQGMSNEARINKQHTINHPTRTHAHRRYTRATAGTRPAENGANAKKRREREKQTTPIAGRESPCTRAPHAWIADDARDVT